MVYFGKEDFLLFFFTIKRKTIFHSLKILFRHFFPVFKSCFFFYCPKIHLVSLQSQAQRPVKIGLNKTETDIVFRDQDLVDKFPEKLILPKTLKRFDALLEMPLDTSEFEFKLFALYKQSF